MDRRNRESISVAWNQRRTLCCLCSSNVPENSRVSSLLRPAATAWATPLHSRSCRRRQRDPSVWGWFSYLFETLFSFDFHSLSYLITLSLSQPIFRIASQSKVKSAKRGMYASLDFFPSTIYGQMLHFRVFLLKIGFICLIWKFNQVWVRNVPGGYYIVLTLRKTLIWTSLNCSWCSLLLFQHAWSFLWLCICV